ncbi:MAG: glycine cleavage system protein H [Pedosphaera sp.]|nr:glycine cleavage system protein H [Pedosphaera sp.]MSU42440.1 glycine cleavage system protein H [Pedosphaera sp.]
MDTGKPATQLYRRSHFVTHLPVNYLFSPSHFWIAPVPDKPGLWRVGLTKFASRMLGEMVDLGLDPAPDAPVEPGQTLGWVEGFKAISDVYCIARGSFAGVNPALREKISLINKDCHGAGWLYAVRGEPGPQCLDMPAYRALLDKTIDKILEQQKGTEIQ